MILLNRLKLASLLQLKSLISLSLSYPTSLKYTASCEYFQVDGEQVIHYYYARIDEVLIKFKKNIMIVGSGLKI